MDPLTILTAFIPAISDGVKGLINKYTGGAGAKPANVQEAIQLGELDIRRLEALAQIDSVGEVSRWVNNVRGMQRPIAVVLIVGAWIYTAMDSSVSPEVFSLASNLAASVVFYLFGDRTYLYFKKKG